ncbi:MAG: UvrB/UvrC motif-containing protein [Acidimicrobiales bacterium]
MYADQMTDSMQRAISETMRRRGVQEAYNLEHGIDPTSVRKEITDILSMIRPAADRFPVPEALSELGAKRRAASDLSDLPEDELERLIRSLEAEMHGAAVDLRFEYAARLRDEIKDLKRELREMR